MHLGNWVSSNLAASIPRTFSTSAVLFEVVAVPLTPEEKRLLTNRKRCEHNTNATRTLQEHCTSATRTLHEYYTNSLRTLHDWTLQEHSTRTQWNLFSSRHVMVGFAMHATYSLLLRKPADQGHDNRVAKIEKLHFSKTQRIKPIRPPMNFGHSRALNQRLSYNLSIISALKMFPVSSFPNGCFHAACKQLPPPFPWFKLP